LHLLSRMIQLIATSCERETGNKNSCGFLPLFAA
jgi:hypothetical protein